LGLRGDGDGLNTSPLFWVKVLRPVVRVLRERGLRVRRGRMEGDESAGGMRLIVYADDILVGGSTREAAAARAETVVAGLRLCGFAVNEGKCRLEPTRVVTFLGFEISASDLTLRIPAEKRAKGRESAEKLREGGCETEREVAEAIGLLGAGRPVVEEAHLHLADAQRWKTDGPPKGGGRKLGIRSRRGGGCLRRGWRRIWNGGENAEPKCVFLPSWDRGPRGA
jgi:hypothetical protein